MSAEPSVFSVGGFQLMVTLVALAVGGLLPEDPELEDPDPELEAPDPELEAPDAELEPAGEPAGADVLCAGTDAAGVELCVGAELCAADEELPDLPPQAESARPRAATVAIRTMRFQPPRLAFMCFSPNCVRPDAGLAGRSRSLRELPKAFSRSSAVCSQGCLLALRARTTTPATPLS